MDYFIYVGLRGFRVGSSLFIPKLTSSNTLKRLATTDLGHTIDKVGLHTCLDNINAIINAPIPNSVTQLKSVLGLINYYGKFVPNLSSTSKTPRLRTGSEIER